AFGDITPQTSNEANVVGCVDEHLKVHLFQQARLSKDENALDNDDWFGLDASGSRQPRMRTKVVNRKLDHLAGIQLFEMLDQQFVIDRIGMIEVRRATIIQRHVLQVAIIKVLLNEDDFICSD